MNFIPWDRPRGAVHDVEYLATLSTDRDYLVCLSERSFYLLLNLAGSDAGFLARYAVEKLDDGYLPCTRAHALYPVVSDAIEALGVELTDMSCDVVAALNEIRDVLTQMSVGINLGNTATCCYTVDPDAYYPPDPGEGEPENLCQLAYAFALYWEAGANEMYHQWALGAFPALGVLAAIFDEFDIPAQALLELVTLGATHALPILESLWRIATSNLVWDITCAIFNASGAAEAQAAIYEAIESVEGIGDIAIQLMEAPITYAGLNKVFDTTFPVEGVETPDCGDCEEQPAGDLFLTRWTEPYNQLVTGDSITFDASNPQDGYRGQNSGEPVLLYFTPDGLATTWEWEAEISAPDYPGETRHYVAHIEVWSGSQWLSVETFGPIEFPADGWTHIYFLVEDTGLPAGLPCRMNLNIQEFNNYIWYRRIAGQTVS